MRCGVRFWKFGNLWIFGFFFEFLEFLDFF